jgi:hypothetical protein
MIFLVPEIYCDDTNIDAIKSKLHIESQSEKIFFRISRLQL